MSTHRVDGNLTVDGPSSMRISPLLVTDPRAESLEDAG
jgi:hypothetical protein